ncbi:MAG TPA: hypothetical protein P5137_17750 [Candidatus Brocadiia bacterium]|nr:hypothetical protein [Candidatus Brocadiia bacterium]
MKAARPIVGIVLLAVCAYVLFGIVQKRNFIAKVQKAHELYEKAQDSNQEKDFAEAKKAYEALLPSAPSADLRKVVEGGAAGCEASIAYLDTTAKPSIEKYEKAIAVFKKAKDLTGDKDGEWSKNIKIFEERLKAAIGPSPADIDAQFQKLAKLPFDKAMRDLENLYFWRFSFKQQNRHQGDKAFDAAFDRMMPHMAKGYAVIFEQTIAEASKAGAADEVLAAPIGALENVKRFDPKMAEALAKKYAKQMAAAQAASKRLEAAAPK